MRSTLQLSFIEVVSAACVGELTMSFWWFFECCSAVEQVKQLTEEECMPVPISACNVFITYMLRLGIGTPFTLAVCVSGVDNSGLIRDRGSFFCRQVACR